LILTGGKANVALVARNYWLLKTEPETYSWARLVQEKSGTWDGVRNYSARNHLREMQKGDYALFYHTGKERAVVGIAEIIREHYPDPTAEKGDFSAVDVKPLQALAASVTLAAIKAEQSLANMTLVRRARLSVQPVLAAEFKKVLAMGKTKI
jgi:predicted RNA-binding protein with PUA-like domain